MCIASTIWSFATTGHASYQKLKVPAVQRLSMLSALQPLKHQTVRPQKPAPFKPTCRI